MINWKYQKPNSNVKEVSYLKKKDSNVEMVRTVRCGTWKKKQNKIKQKQKKTNKQTRSGVLQYERRADGGFILLDWNRNTRGEVRGRELNAIWVEIKGGTRKVILNCVEERTERSRVYLNYAFIHLPWCFFRFKSLWAVSVAI